MTHSRLISLTGLLVAIAFVAMTTDAAYAQYTCLQTAGKRGERGNLEDGCTTLTRMGESGAWVRARPIAASGYRRNREVAWCAEVEPGLERNVTGYRDLLECLELNGAAGTGIRPLFVKVIGVRRGGAGGGRTPSFAALPSVKTFKGMGEPSTLKAADIAVSCEEAVDAGEVTGMSTIGKLTVTFTGCQVTAASKTCTIKSTSAKEGEIVTNTLMGELGTTKSEEATSEVGLLLLPESGKTWTILAETSCSLESRVTGTLAGEVLPISEKTEYTGLEFGVSSQKQNIQDIIVASGLVQPSLTAFSETATEEFGDGIEFNGEVEIV